MRLKHVRGIAGETYGGNLVDFGGALEGDVYLDVLAVLSLAPDAPISLLED